MSETITKYNLYENNTKHNKKKDQHEKIELKKLPIVAKFCWRGGEKRKKIQSVILKNCVIFLAYVKVQC